MMENNWIELIYVKEIIWKMESFRYWIIVWLTAWILTYIMEATFCARGIELYFVILCNYL